MTVMTRVPGRPDWTAGPLYTLLLESLPAHLTPSGVLDVQGLKSLVGKSHEAIYKWLRQGKLKPANARILIEIANKPANVEALRAAGREPPKIEDFLPYFI
ncbi:hypothetical protein I5E68_09680 [Novosphingobium sp. YJ-S2-02]|uniref:Uncharacterized protein n=1 Tax=Novosphingobium aureum TaxID=2792964 RepID=A0A931ML95_9SPHN|nr:hypothetical protein [Novosphingobium aureum]MBH0113215.1 hypothetical protein [Novosphingobium aureum]